eukprot:CAMPEP_0202492374 /NCGR_PEP_ID=MMETSP1361-20130828/9107_1 /ASSEMBLY_ACC=CAM_ASM_000849 /TAXON_ID=210615 /ORGANISM="Staurosira complex sp., Strain CCMP2646" /LENGTH=637 /DNA_ID=CAMNT_0049122569 /DNA_START=48 /DNA_END=1961 /DNA_ORIENTATION=-
METPESFLEKNKGFVLKLRLVGVGGPPQIRRIRLPRVAVGGCVSYDALVNVAISYTFPDAPLNPKDYDVALTYYDVDNDCVTIASTDELMDAISQFSDVLRITTDVTRKKRPILSATRQPSRGDMDTDPAPMNNGAKQLHNVLESFVGILATAVVALQSHMNPGPSAAEASSVPLNEAASRAAADPTVAADANETEEKKEEPSKKDDTPPVKEEAPRPFIHGRHTCDRCLCTPIVGDRYHATNLPDYDLCGKCKESYKGDEIQFELAELDRDRPFQDRWHRKRERFAAAGRCRPGPRSMGGHRGPGPNRHGSGSIRGPNRPGSRGRGRFGPGPHGSRVATAQQMDDALKEAIRRSLQDVNKAAAAEESKPIATVEEPKPTAPAEVVVVAPKEEDVKSSPINTDVKVEETKNNESFSVDAVGNGDVAEVLGQTLDQCADAIDAMVKEMNRSSSESSTESKDDDSNATNEDEDEVFVETFNEAEAEETAGATILESVGVDVVTTDEASLKSARSEEEWEVVAEDAEQVDDETLARAAQIIGSALFESDNLSRGDASSLTGGAEGSFLSSVPTITSDSNVPAPVLDQWAAQLIQLRELGFADDAASVDILERLQAANIGSDSMEEIILDRVVNELLKKNE